MSLDPSCERVDYRTEVIDGGGSIEEVQVEENKNKNKKKKQSKQRPCKKSELANEEGAQYDRITSLP